MIILGIETSCDDTSIAIVENGKKILSHYTYSQMNHNKFNGVVPEIASRMHLEAIFDLLEKALSESQLELSGIDAIAVTKEPGLAGSLLVGLTVAKTLAYMLKKPLIPINHLWAHLYAPFLEENSFWDFPYIGLLVSGGHTLLCKINSFQDIEVKGSTIDDAVGESFDKVSKMLGLGYPGGPLIEALAESGNPAFYDLPSMSLNYSNDRYNFSYSGLKTAVRRVIQKEGENLQKEHLAASFQKKALDILIKKTHLLCQDEGLDKIIIAGGVACNSYLKKNMREFGNNQSFKVLHPSRNLSTDNAAMVAGYAFHQRKLEQAEFLQLDINDTFISLADKKNLRKF